MATLPFASVSHIAGPGPVLVLAPHPDDESLGCGGFIAQTCAAGISVHVAVLTDGTMSHPGSASYPAPRLQAVREAETAAATRILGLPPGRLLFLRHGDAAAPRSGRRLRLAGDQLARIIASLGIRTVLASWRHDPHCDHLAAHRIAVRACRLTGARHLAYAVWGWTLPSDHTLPRTRVRGWRLDITRELSTKQGAIGCHASQLGGLITDDPAGFAVPPRLMELCGRPFETILRQP